MWFGVPHSHNWCQNWFLQRFIRYFLTFFLFFLLCNMPAWYVQSSGVQCTEDVVDAWDKMKLKRTYGYLICKINMEAGAIELETVGFLSYVFCIKLSVQHRPRQNWLDQSKIILVLQRGDPHADVAASKTTYENEFLSALPEKEGRFCLYDFQFTIEDGGVRMKPCFILWYVTSTQSSLVSEMAMCAHLCSSIKSG